ncbi:MAG: efflux RND transporter periplasmic adaptor subunit [Wenzhouxiangellaceae bacterium]
MNKSNDFTRTTATAAAVLLSALLLSACGNGTDANANIDDDATVMEPSIPVEISQVGTGTVAASYEGTATLEPERQATVVAKTTGVVLEILAEEGDSVSAGQIIARLEQDQYALEAERARANLERLENELERATELHKRQLMSADEYERARFDTAAQRAAYNLAKLELDRTEIRAPISGVISERLVKVGNLITQHEPVFRIDDFSPLWAILHVPERELNTLQQGQPVALNLDAYPAEQFSGRVLRISPVVDPATGTFKVTAEISDETGRIKPGLFGRVQIIYDRRDNVPVVSKGAVLSEDGRNAVFVLAADNTVQRREITLGYEQNDVVEVIDGLTPGDRVVTAGKGSLRDGATVEVIQP